MQEADLKAAQKRVTKLELALKWLLENDELTQYGRKTAEEALRGGE